MFLTARSFPFVLCFAICNRLPLHIVWSIRSATSQPDSVCNHVPWSAFRIPSLNHERALGCSATSETRRAAQEQQNQDLLHILPLLRKPPPRQQQRGINPNIYTHIPNYTRLKVVSCELQSLSQHRRKGDGIWVVFTKCVRESEGVLSAIAWISAVSPSAVPRGPRRGLSAVVNAALASKLNYTHVKRHFGERGIALRRQPQASGTLPCLGRNNGSH